MGHNELKLSWKMSVILHKTPRNEAKMCAFNNFLECLMLDLDLVIKSADKARSRSSSRVLKGTGQYTTDEENTRWQLCNAQSLNVIDSPTERGRKGSSLHLVVREGRLGREILN